MAVDHLRPAMNNNILLFTGFFINYSRRNPDYRNYHDNIEHVFPEVNGGKDGLFRRSGRRVQDSMHHFYKLIRRF